VSSYDYNAYTTGVLKAAGLPLTRSNLEFVTKVWIPSEGTSARFNPLATTTRRPGSTAFNRNGGYPVQNFKSIEDGISATAQTLTNGRYGPLVSLLARGNASAQDLSKAVQQSPWGTKQGLIGQLAAGSKAEFSSGSASAPLASPRELNAGGRDASNPFTRRAAVAQRFLADAQRTLTGSRSTSKWLEGIIEQTQKDEAPATGSGPVPSTAGVGSPNPGPQGGVIYTSKGWAGTHVTDGLGWGTKTAGDIMANPGTIVDAPEDGQVVRWGSAQGGQSMYFKGVSGKTYWLGHIDGRLPVGTTVRANQPIARVSKDHPRPHLHIDVRG